MSSNKEASSWRIFQAENSFSVREFNEHKIIIQDMLASETQVQDFWYINASERLVLIEIVHSAGCRINSKHLANHLFHDGHDFVRTE